jgi:aminopeptidase N
MRKLILFYTLFFFFIKIYSQGDISHLCSQGKSESLSDFRLGYRTYEKENYDVYYYLIDLEIFPALKTISGSVKIVANILNETDKIEIDLVNTLSVNKITLDSKPLYFEHKNDLLTINLGKKYAAGNKIELIINYSGTPGSAFHFDIVNNQPMIWSLTQPYGSRDWFPCKNNPDDKADSVRLKITVPSNLIVVSNGKLDLKTENNDKITYIWIEKYPIVSYLISVAIHPYIKTTEYFKYSLNDSLPVEHYLVPSTYEANKDLYKITTQMLQAFSERYGLYPFINEKYGHAEVPFNGGMEHQTITSLLGPYEYLVAHELGHQWWGDMITCQDFHHIWLNEGFATYSEALWAESKSGIQELHNVMKSKIYLGKGSVYVENISDKGRIFNQSLSYNKAAWVLHMLRHVVGDNTFFQILKTWGSSDKRFGVAVTEDFQNTCEQVSGKDLSKFFNQWIYGDFHPIYLYDWSYIEKNGFYEINLILEQFQLGTLYSMPIDIIVKTENGEEKFVVQNDNKIQSYTFVVPSKPTEIILDKENWILKEVKQGISLVNQDNNNIILSLSTDGSLGFDKPDGFGNGLIYPENGQNNLFFGTFIIGNSSDYVADNSANEGTKDLVKNQNIKIGYTNISDLDISLSFSDSAHPLSKDLVINQTSYSWNSDPYRNFNIINYQIKNNSTSPIENLYPGMFLDLDIGDYLENYIKKDDSEKLIYMHNENHFIGIKKLGNDDKSIYHSGILDAIDTWKEKDKFDFLSGVSNQYDASKKSDWSILSSSGPYDLPAGNEMTISYAIVGGASEQQLKSNATYAQILYSKHIVSTSESNITNNQCMVFPNPVNDQLNVYFTDKEPYNIEIVDILGNKIKNVSNDNHKTEISIPISEIKPGMYFVIVKNKQSTQSIKVIKQ